MTIKEVEKRTGLTAKSIRLYESKGLFQIERNSRNDYRNFTEENVKQLQFIKILRYLDFSIQEIGELMEAEEDAIKAALQKKLSDYEGTREQLERKEEVLRGLCRENLKNASEKGIYGEYLKLIDFVESEEAAEIDAQIKAAKHPSIAAVCAQTLVCLGPVLWLFVNFHMEKWEMMKFNIPLALLGTVFLTLVWRNYIFNMMHNRAYQKKQNRGSLLVLPMILAVLFGSFGGMVFIAWLQEKLFLPEEWLFYQTYDSSWLLMLLTVEGPLIVAGVAFLHHLYPKNEWEWAHDILKIFRKFWIPIVCVWVFLIYAAVTGITFVTETQIVYHDWLHPAGAAYSYDEIERVETGYSGKTFSIAEKKGTFYYRIYFDGKKVNLGGTTPNEAVERFDDSYLELEEFDEALMLYQPGKVSSHENEEYAILDERYIKRFGRIIDNK